MFSFLLLAYLNPFQYEDMLPNERMAYFFETLPLIQGNQIDPPDYKSMVISIHSLGCTATVIGPRVILTAAHCIKSQTLFRMNGKIYKAKFYGSPLYPSTYNDIAVGITTSEMDARPAVIDKDKVWIGQQLLLSGYGCSDRPTSVLVRPSGWDGHLRTGLSRVILRNYLDFVTEGGAALCYGDSGGPVFLPKTNHVVGINSRADMKTTSYMTRLDSIESITFLKIIAITEGVDICGINKDCD